MHRRALLPHTVIYKFYCQLFCFFKILYGAD